MSILQVFPCLLLLLLSQFSFGSAFVVGCNSLNSRSLSRTTYQNEDRESRFIHRRDTTALQGSALSDELVWGIRIFSAVGSYVGFVAYYDRPRGVFNMQEGVDVEIKPSLVEGAGLGLFAKKNLEKGTILGTYPGAVIPLQQNLEKLKQYPPCEGYIWRFSDNRYVIDPTNAVGELDPVSLGGNPSFPGSTFLMQNILKLSVPTALCRINEPPRGKDVNVVTSEDLESRCVTFELERDVYAGEEFYIDYGLSYDRSMYGGGGSSGGATDGLQ